MDKSKVLKVVREYRRELKRLFGDHLVEVILYGSFARGEGHEGSDVDVLCVLRSPFDDSEAIRKSSELTARLSLEHDVVISSVFASEEDFRTRDLPFFMNVRNEGISV